MKETESLTGTATGTDDGYQQRWKGTVDVTVLEYQPDALYLTL